MFYLPTFISQKNLMKYLWIIFLSFFSIFNSIAQENYLETYSGGVKPGDVDGPIDFARFRNPVGLAINKDGNILLADQGNQKIKLINLVDLAVITFAVSRVQGYLDGPKEVAVFSFPGDIVSDEIGNIYVTDPLNNVIRKIDTAGIVTTAVGSGEFGYKDGPADSAQFSSAGGLAFDSKGNLFFRDIFNNRIRKVSLEGMVSTFVGGGVTQQKDTTVIYGEFRDGKNEESRFYNPSHLIIDKDDVLWVSDYNNGAIRKIDSDGNVSTFLGTICPGKTEIRGYKDGRI